MDTSQGIPKYFNKVYFTYTFKKIKNMDLDLNNYYYTKADIS